MRRGAGDRQVGDLIADVLANTRPDGASKVKYRLDEQVAERVRARAAELIGAHPLYPEVDLTPAG